MNNNYEAPKGFEEVTVLTNDADMAELENSGARGGCSWMPSKDGTEIEFTGHILKSSNPDVKFFFTEITIFRDGKSRDVVISIPSLRRTGIDTWTQLESVLEHDSPSWELIQGYQLDWDRAVFLKSLKGTRFIAKPVKLTAYRREWYTDEAGRRRSKILTDSNENPLTRDEYFIGLFKKDPVKKK